VAEDLGRPPAQFALAWVLGRPQVASVLVGATSREQLDANLGALSLELPPEVRDALDGAGALEANELDHFFEATIQRLVTGGVAVARTGVIR
jgi:aryl-alcohol dehydrogenase-like predicted oxidoreductase